MLMLIFPFSDCRLAFEPWRHLWAFGGNVLPPWLRGIHGMLNMVIAKRNPERPGIALASALTALALVLSNLDRPFQHDLI